MTPYESIRVETRDRVTTVIMARPERRNAVDGPMAAEPADAPRALQTGDRGGGRLRGCRWTRTVTVFPQTCMRNDRRSVYEQFGRSESEALGFVFALGMESVGSDTVGGAARFASGEGRHGSFS